MESSPDGIDIEKIRSEIQKLPDIENPHHIHIWRLTDAEIHFECHADLKNNLAISATDEVRMKIEKILKEKYHISHVTIQMEYDTCMEKDSIKRLGKSPY